MADAYAYIETSSINQALVDTVSGSPAVVFGDDGLSTFPATVTSGGTAVDSDGNSYNFPAGGFRFPFVAPGTYRLDVTPSTGWQAPSVEPTPNLQALPGGPFVIVEPGSRGEPFTLNPGPALHIDLPIDPVIIPIGPGATPFATDRGWLHIYHGVFPTMDGSVYRLGVALHDFDDPARIIGVADEWILQPEDAWELAGYVHNVVFTCGAIPEDDGTVKIYWGGADSVMCAGTAMISDIVDLCLSHPRPALGI